MLADTRIILRHHPYEVHAQRHEIMFKDGSAVGLHPVHAYGLPMLLLRVLALNGGHYQLFDLAKLRLSFDSELRGCPTVDQVGFVFYRLREHYTSAAEFTADVNRKCIGNWLPAGSQDSSHAWHAAARQHDGDLLGQAAAATFVPRGRLSQAQVVS